MLFTTRIALDETLLVILEHKAEEAESSITAWHDLWQVSIHVVLSVTMCAHTAHITDLNASLLISLIQLRAYDLKQRSSIGSRCLKDLNVGSAWLILVVLGCHLRKSLLVSVDFGDRSVVAT